MKITHRGYHAAGGGATLVVTKRSSRETSLLVTRWLMASPSACSVLYTDAVSKCRYPTSTALFTDSNTNGLLICNQQPSQIDGKPSRWWVAPSRHAPLLSIRRHLLGSRSSRRQRSEVAKVSTVSVCLSQSAS